MTRGLVLGFLALSVVFGVGCTTTVGEECGPFPNAFKTTGFATSLAQLDSIAATGRPVLSAVADDTIRGRLAVQMEPKTEAYTTALRHRVDFSLIPSARACSPPIPESEEVIRDLRVYSTVDLGPDHPAGTNLAPLVDVVALYRAGVGYRRADLPDFLAEAPNAADELVLVLDAAPDTTTRARFTVEYEQEGRGLESYSYTTAPVAWTRP